MFGFGKLKRISFKSQAANLLFFAAMLTSTGCINEFPDLYREEMFMLDLLSHQTSSSAVFPETLPTGTPPSEVTSLGLWFKADSLSLTDGTQIASWPDSSPNGFDAANATAAEQPLYRTNALNSMPVIEFDGTDDFLVSSDVDFSGITYLAVAKLTKNWNPSWGTFGHRMNIISQFADFPNDSTQLFFNWAEISGSGALSLTHRARVDGVGLYTASTGPSGVSQNQWYLVAARYDGDQVQLYLNGTLVSDQGPYTGLITNSPFAFNIGRHENTTGNTHLHRFGGQIAEVMMYTRALTSDELEGITCHLSIKYALSISHSCE